MAKFWQTYTPVVVDLTKWITFTPVRGTEKLRAQIVIPTFSVDTSLWLGSNYITLEFRANFRENFSIVTPVRKPANANFILAVRSVRDFISSSDYFVDRHKFWNLNDGTEELTSWDIYNGEAICKSFSLEIWSSEGKDKTSLDTPIILDTSILIPVEDCCDSVHELIPVSVVCNLFAELPLEL